MTVVKKGARGLILGGRGSQYQGVKSDMVRCIPYPFAAMTLNFV